MGLVGNDIHVVANRLLAIGMAENHFLPFNIGTNNEVEDFIDAVYETGAAAVLVASVNGEGETACRGFGQAFEESGLEDTLLYVGGNLSVGAHSVESVNATFVGYGFNRVFHRPPSFQVVFDSLRQDLTGFATAN